jgi:heptosyltransferase-3
MSEPPVPLVNPPNRSALTDAVDFSRVQRVLVVKLRFHGDVLLATPVFSALKQRHPHVEIDALVYREALDMLTIHPDVAQIFGIDRSWKQLGFIDHLRAEIGLLRRLRARRYDLLIHLTEHWRGPILKRLLGIPLAVTERYARRERSRFWRHSFTHHYRKPRNPRHKVESHLDALRRIGVYPERQSRALRLVPGPDAQVSARAKLARLGLNERSFVLIHPTSRFLYKCWTVEGMVQLIDRLQPNVPVLLTAAPSAAELEMVEAIRTRTRTAPASLAGQLDLKELAYCIGAARLFVGVDSAPMHMAAAMQTPVVALFGPTSQTVWAPWQVPHRIVATRPSCQPCHLRGCGEGHVADCLMAIDVDSVWQACQDLLALECSR